MRDSDGKTPEDIPRLELRFVSEMVVKIKTEERRWKNKFVLSG
jgi:hypothetical protein